MKDIKTTFRGLLLGILLLMIPIIVVGLIIVNNKLAYLLGVFIGTITSIGLLKHMQITVLKAVEKTPKAAEHYAIRSYLIRSFFMVAVLLLGIIRKEINVVGIFLGLFSIKISAYIFPYVNNLINKEVE